MVRYGRKAFTLVPMMMIESILFVIITIISFFPAAVANKNATKYIQDDLNIYKKSALERIRLLTRTIILISDLLFVNLFNTIFLSMIYSGSVLAVSYTHLLGFLTTMKGIPLAYNKDMQEDKEPVFDAYDTAKICAITFEKMIGTMTVNTEVMRKSAAGGF